MKLLEKLQIIQSKLKAPKNQRNNFGNYNYRSCEDILEAVKPLLEEQKLTLTITDDIVSIGNRYYVKSTPTISDGEESLSVSAMARESETKKGMDDSQITGACSSYARKYALNGLFLIDDTKDADSMDNTKEEKSVEKLEKPQLVDSDKKKLNIVKLCKSLGYTGNDYKMFVFTTIGEVLEPKNFDKVIEELTKLNNIK